MANSTVKVTVTITYEHPGTTPPIFIAGSFTTPAWQPIELDHRQTNEEYVFSKAFDMAPGTHQYKFRVGFGDWWACDDSRDTEVDEAGNVNNVMTVQSSPSNDLSQPGEESSPCDQGIEAFSKTSSDRCQSPSLGLDGIEDSNEETARSLREEVGLTDNTVAEIRGANGIIESADSKLDTAGWDDPRTQDASATLASGSVITTEQAPLANDIPARDSCVKDSSLASNASPETGQASAHKKTMVAGGEEKVVSQKLSVSAIAVTNCQKDQKDFWLTRFCRVVVQGVTGSMSSLLCGKRRK